MVACNPRVAVINHDPVSGGGSVRGGIGGAPILMGSSLELDTPGALGVTLNMKELQPLKKAAYFIDEIRFSLYGTPDTSAVVTNADGLAGAVYAEFSTGQFALSKRPMPIALHAPRHSMADYGLNALGGSGVAPNFIPFHSVRWLLPQPLYMLPGEVLQCRLSRDAVRLATGPASFFCSVGYAGRMVTPGAPLPQTRHVPWASWFEKLLSEAEATTQTEFRNPFQKPMHVQRFTLQSYAVDGTNTFTPNEEALFPRVVDPFERITMDDSLGYKIVGNMQSSAASNQTQKPPSVGSVFDVPRRSWTFGRELGVREQFNIKLTRDGAAPMLDNATQIGMIAYREENF